MLEKTPFSVHLDTIEEARTSLPHIDFKVSLNKPTGRFFYDPWVIKEEFKDTVWEKILDSIPGPIGEARIIQLVNGTCYMSHCDIDDRYHLNIEGQYSFLIDVDNQKMYPTVADGQWYTINTGVRHVAANFGSIFRNQLVVRKLLNSVNLLDPVSVTINPICKNPRFEFDDIISPWLHKMNRLRCLSDFKVNDSGVEFNLAREMLSDLDSFSRSMFKIVIKK